MGEGGRGVREGGRGVREGGRGVGEGGRGVIIIITLPSDYTAPRSYAAKTTYIYKWVPMQYVYIVLH